ncbi:MAG: DUF262 domain-containing protein [Polyangiales bacterium]
MNESLRIASVQTQVRPYKVEDLLRLAREGRLRIPAFQRPPRWRSEHVVRLFESVAQGFPVGTLFFAVRDEPAGVVRFGPFVAEAPEVRDALVVVDGQQRVSALVGALLHPATTPRGDIHAIWLDLENERFVRATATPPETWVPLRALGDSRETLRWLRGWALASEREDLVERALNVGKLLREFSLSCAVVPGDDEAQLRQMFQRLNTSGVSMTADEVFAALHGHAPETDLHAAAVRVAGAGFGEPAEKDVRQCLLCVDGRPPGMSAAELDSETIRALIPRTERAMVEALRFLAVNASVARLELLPYRVPLRILARYFDRFGDDVSGRARTLLRRWVWRGSLSGLFATSSEARVRSLQKIVDDRSPEVVAKALLDEVGVYAIALDPVEEPWSSTSARSRFAAIALLAHGPLRLSDRAPFTGESSRKSPTGDEGDALPFIESFVDVAGRARGPIVGRVLVECLEDLGALADADDAILESQLIPASARGALREVLAATREEDRRAAAARFDALRGPTLQAWVERFLRAQCEPGADDRVSIATLVAPYRDEAQTR